MVYITGDMHGDFSRFSSASLRKLKKGDTLIVCGDFGFVWDGSKREQKRLKKIGRLRYHVLFVEGPHENYDLLYQCPLSEWNGGQVRTVSGGLRQLVRGHIFEIEGHTFFAFGGGQSADHDLRADGGAWWPEEMPSPAEMTAGISRLAAQGNRVDYIITHQPSAKSRAFLSRAGSGFRTPGPDGVHIYLNHLEESVSYTHWYFGSLHLDKAVSRQHTAVFTQVVPAGSVRATPGR